MYSRHLFPYKRLSYIFLCFRIKIRKNQLGLNKIHSKAIHKIGITLMTHPITIQLRLSGFMSPQSWGESPTCCTRQISRGFGSSPVAISTVQKELATKWQRERRQTRGLLGIAIPGLYISVMNLFTLLSCPLQNNVK